MSDLPRPEWYQDPDHPDDPLRIRYWDGQAWTEHRSVMQPAQPQPVAPVQQAVLVVQSHEEGRNATVTLYPNRIERVQQRKRTSLSGAHQGTEVTSIKAVTSVETRKDGMAYTLVICYVSANAVSFRLRHDQAEQFKAAIMNLIL